MAETLLLLQVHWAQAQSTLLMTTMQWPNFLINAGFAVETRASKTTCHSRLTLFKRCPLLTLCLIDKDVL